MRRSLLLLPAFAVLLGLATVGGRAARAAIAVPDETDTTVPKLRMIVVHRDGFETLVVQPEFELPVSAGREVTINEEASEFSKTYGEPFRASVGLCNARYGDQPGKIAVKRLKTDVEAAVTHEGISDHSVQCVKAAFQLSAYEDVLHDPDDIELTFTIAPNPAGRPPRLAWVIPVKGEPLHFGKAPSKIFDEVALSTEELLPAAPLGSAAEGLPPPNITTVSDFSIARVPGQGMAAVAALQKMLADGQFGEIRASDLAKYRGEWSFLVARTGSPAPLIGRMDPVAVTFRADKLTIPARIYGRTGAREAQVWIFSDRIIPPAGLRSFGFTFAGKYHEDGRQDGVDYQAKHFPQGLKAVVKAAAKVAPPLVPLASQGAVYRLDGIPLAVQPGVWSSECELPFSTFSSPRKMPGHVDRIVDEAARQAEADEGCGCRTTRRGALPASALACAAAFLATRPRRRRHGPSS